MIKLIVTDMDGTLLDSQKELSPGFPEVYKALTDKGVVFAVASGRPYYTLVPQFEDIEHDIILIGDNGAYIGTHPEPVITNSFTKAQVDEIIEVGRKVNDVYLIICTPEKPYCESNDDVFLKEALKYYPNMERLDSLNDVSEQVLKVAILDVKTWELNSGNAWSVFAGKHVVAKSGSVWIDIMPQGVNKGEAVRFLQNKLNISKDETMAFGDFHNDIEMLQRAKYSYAMKNAHDDIKKIARFEAPGNDDDGVMKVIEEVVLGNERK